MCVCIYIYIYIILEIIFRWTATHSPDPRKASKVNK